MVKKIKLTRRQWVLSCLVLLAVCLISVRTHTALAATTYSIGGQVTNSGQSQPVGKTGFLITLSGPTSRSALTGGNGGSYFFSGLPKGQYIIHLILPSGYTSCGPTTVMTSLGPNKIINFCVSYFAPPPPPPATVACDGFTPSIATPDPYQAFTLKVQVLFNPTTAAATAFGPDKLNVQLTGPAPYGGVSKSDGSPSIANGVASTILNVPPTHVSGTFNLTWQVAGSQAPTISCSDTIRVAYVPYFTVAGGDVSAGQDFGSGCNADMSADIEGENLDDGSSPANYFGSGTRQAALATGDIANFATDATNDLASGLGGSASGMAAFQPGRLAFANASPSAGTYGGGFIGAGPTDWCVPDYVAGVGPATSTSMPTSAGLNGLPANGAGYVYRVTGSQQLNGNVTLQPGVHVTIVVTDGDFYLGGNVRYANYTSVQDIPQFTLILTGSSSGNLYINSGVQELRGFYDSQPSSSGKRGVTFTCASAPGTEATDYATCDTPLTVYGAVAARLIVLGRTHGTLSRSGGIPNDPAEQFVYTPELWLGMRTTCPRTLTQVGCVYQAYTSLPPVL